MCCKCIEVSLEKETITIINNNAYIKFQDKPPVFQAFFYYFAPSNRRFPIGF